MKRYILAVLIVGLCAVSGYAQDNQSSADQNAPAVEKTIQPQEVSIYGEVRAVNTAAGSMTVQYYDYDSDEEKSIEITTDSNTKMENASSLADIKQGNWADVMYGVVNGKNVAKSVIVEKEEEAPAAEMPKAEATPPAMPQQ